MNCAGLRHLLLRAFEKPEFEVQSFVAGRRAVNSYLGALKQLPGAARCAPACIVKAD